MGGRDGRDRDRGERDKQRIEVGGKRREDRHTPPSVVCWLYGVSYMMHDMMYKYDRIVENLTFSAPPLSLSLPSPSLSPSPSSRSQRRRIG